MATADLKLAHKVTAKGRTYWYAWRGRGAPRLEGEPGSPQFHASYARALEGRLGVDKTRIAGLCAMFRASDAWQGKGPRPISEKTKASWSLWLDRIQIEFGELRVQQFDRPQMRPIVIKWRDSFAKTPRAADMGVQVLSRLLAFGQAEGKLLNNICTGIEGLYESDRSGLIWTERDLAERLPHADTSIEIVRTARLASLTGLRKAVLLRLGSAHRRKHHLEIRSNKGRNGRPGKLVLIPLYPELKAFLDALPKRKDATTYLVNTEGRPWGSGFNSSWARAKARAEIDDLHFHDLRGTAATKFYVAGLTIREIAKILGWSEDYVEALIERYVKQDEVMLDLIARMTAAAARKAAAAAEGETS